MKFMAFAAIVFLGLCPFVAKKYLYNKLFNPSETLTQIMEERHSGSSFDPKKTISEDKIRSIIHAAQLTPSSYNEQPWNFIICDKTKNLDAYNKVFSTLHRFNQNWAKNAPVLVLAAASKNSSKNNEPNLWAEYDTGAAAFGISMQATALGLMAHQIAGFDQVKISQLLDLPADIKPISIIALGYEDVNQSSAKSKERKPVGDNFFQGSWGLTNEKWS